MSFNEILMIDQRNIRFQDNFIISAKLGLNLDPSLRVHLTNGSRNGSGMELISSLTHEVVWKLFQHYRIDFEMFDYDPIPYLLSAQPSKV